MLAGGVAPDVDSECMSLETVLLNGDHGGQIAEVVNAKKAKWAVGVLAGTELVDAERAAAQDEAPQDHQLCSQPAPCGRAAHLNRKVLQLSLPRTFVDFRQCIR